MPEQTVPEISESASLSGNGSIRELALFFLRLGTTAFGGPAAHLAIMEDELVRRRRCPLFAKAKAGMVCPMSKAISGAR
jgi:chromate transporter